VNASFADRTLSTSFIQRIASAASVDHLDPASDESLDSGRLQIRSHSIPNGVLASELEPLNNNKHGASFTMGGLTITTTAPSIPNLSSINEKTNSGNSINSSNYSNNNSLSTLTGGGSAASGPGGGITIVAGSGHHGGGGGGGGRHKSNPRRLSIKQDQLPIDSIC